MHSETLEKYIEIPDGRLYAKVWNAEIIPSVPPIILLHDSLGSVEMWRDLPAKLSEQTRRPVIAYDRLGFGRSSKRELLPSIHFVEEEGELYLRHVLAAFHIDKFSLFGHSVGGGMSIVAAGFYPERCLSVVSESAQAFVEDRTKAGIIQAEKDFANPGVFAKLERYHGDKTRWVLDAWIKVWLSDAFADWSLKEFLPRMKCPALIIHGDKDEYGSVKFPDMICEFSGGLTTKQILENVGHVPHRDEADHVIDLIADFLKITS